MVVASSLTANISANKKPKRKYIIMTSQVFGFFCLANKGQITNLDKNSVYFVLDDQGDILQRYKDNLTLLARQLYHTPMFDIKALPDQRKS
jgi:hypothetical protein